ncbi:hypothetical protein [Streptomyces laurentii]|uniref:hypothetical protein n=1 Tax=Streptomyces laurentii TaxID=39478 RepID=UPI003407CE93
MIASEMASSGDVGIISLIVFFLVGTFGAVVLLNVRGVADEFHRFMSPSWFGTLGLTSAGMARALGGVVAVVAFANFVARIGSLLL